MLICVPIVVESAEQALRAAMLAGEHGAGIVEYRVDGFFSGDDAEFALQAAELERLVASSPLACIVTCRHASEGGAYDGPEDARVSLYERLCTSGKGPAYIDIELKAFARSANIRQKLRLCVQHPGQLREVPTRLILSVHDFAGLPQDLARSIAAMHDEPACSVMKVAARARNLHDALELLDTPARCAKPAIMLGMGEFGVCTRVLGGKFGSMLTFAPLHAKDATAPGQLSLRSLLGTFRAQRVRSGTRVFGIVGWPVQASLSPAVHNAAFAEAGEEGVYVHLPIAAHGAGVGVGAADGAEDAAASRAGFVATMRELLAHPVLHLCGCSVTMPHKRALAELAQREGWEADAATRAVGAANTLVVDREWDAAGHSRVRGARVMNTDVIALRGMLQEGLHEGLGANAAGKLVGKRVGIVGAGGVGAAAAWAAASLGAHVVIYNRTRERGEELAARLREAIPEATGNIVAMGLDALERSCCDAFVQATSVGMGTESAGELAMPIPAMRACESASVRPLLIETIYHPLETPVLREARRAGWRTVDGLELFVRQAELQSEAFCLGKAPRAGMMREVVLAALAERAG